MKNFTAYILAALFALTGVCGSASAIVPPDQTPVTGDWGLPLADTDYPVEIVLDKTVYYREDTVINGELLNYSWDMEPGIIEIISLDTNRAVFYSEAKESTFSIDIDLHPGEYRLRLRRGTSRNAYWDSYWDTGLDWDGWADAWYAAGDVRGDTSLYSSSAYFSVVGASDLFHLSGKAEIEIIPNTKALLNARLEWDGLSGGGPYTLTQTDEKYEKGKVTRIEGIYDSQTVVGGLQLGNIYTYTVSDGERSSNPIVIDLSAIPPLEYAGSKINKLIVLKIGDPYMYFAEGKSSALDGTRGEFMRAIDEDDLSVTPVMVNDLPMIPVAALVREMGGSVSWDGAKRVVTLNLLDSVTMKSNTLEIPIDSETVYLNGEKKTLDVSALIKYDRTLVPIRMLKLLGCDIKWDSESESIVICYWDDSDMK